ncbi:MAG: NfeD family protein [Vulcanimicrobiota bacterium]
MNKRRLIITGVFLAILSITTLEQVFGITLVDSIAASSFGGIIPAWALDTAHFLSSPIPRIIILALGIICLFIELVTLTAIAGTISIFLFSLYFASHIIAGFAPWWSIFVFAAGLIFLALEIFVVPGVGITGITGVILTLSGLFIATGDLFQGGISMLASLILAAMVVAVIFKRLPKSKLWKKLTLEVRQTSKDGYQSVKVRKDLEGQIGETLTDLRPTGVALINGERVDVVSEGSFVKKDSNVQVTKIQGAKVVVRQL